MLVVFLRAQFVWRTLPYFLCLPFHHDSKYFFIKRKPRHVNVNQSWVGPIIYPNSDDEDASELEDDNIISKELYIAKFCGFPQNTYTRVLGLVNDDVNQLQ